MAHYFLTALGTVNYDERTYELESKTWRSRFAPVATARLTAITEGRAIVLVTQAVRNGATFPLMRQELTESGLVVDTIETADRIDATALLELVTRLGESVPAGSELTLDVTYGLRHLPFVYHAALLFLTGLKETRVAGIYYGARELQGPDETVPLIDLTPTLRLIQWFSGLRALRDYGDARELAKLFRGEVAELFQSHSGSLALGQIKDSSLALGRSLALGLPLEMGLAASNLRRAVAGADRNAMGLSAMQMMAESVEQIAAADSVRDKKTMALDQGELGRQLRVARWYKERSDFSKALAVLREWVVNAAILALGLAPTWLERGCRQSVERLLHAANERQRAGLASPQESRLGSLWDSVADLRNSTAHAGMRPQTVDPSPKRLAAAIDACGRLLAEGLPANLGRLTPRGRLLVTALGLSPGVLYSAVSALEPESAIIITSAKARGAMHEALSRAGCPDLQVLVRELEDPHSGFNESARVTDPEIVSALAAASQVVVNLTGGTTAMQWVVESMAERAARLGTPVRRIALVDRRSAEEQRAEPYVRGELIELNAPPIADPE